MTTYSIQIDSQFRFTGQDASTNHAQAEYPSISGYLGDVFSFTFFQNEIYAFTIENTTFEDKYDISYFGDGTTESWTPTATGVYEYSNPVDFETFGNITILDLDSTTTTTTTVDPSAPTTTTTTTVAPPEKIFSVRIAYNLNDEGNRFYINNDPNPILNFVEGKLYRFDVSDPSNPPHPFRLSTTSDGTHGGGSEYTSTVTYNNNFIDVIAPSENLYYYCANHPAMGRLINIIPSATPTTTTSCPLDNCGCGSISFPPSGTLKINNVDYTLLHRNEVPVGQGQKFVTAVDRIPSGTPIYANSISLDLSDQACVSHNVELTVTLVDDLKFNPKTYKSEKEYNIISLLNVGLPSGTFYIDKPLIFKNINNNLDLQDKIVTLTAQSICNYEAQEPCCDKLPTSFSIQYPIEDLKVTYVPTTTTTTTTAAPAPRSFIDNLVSDEEPLFDIDFEYTSDPAGYTINLTEAVLGSTSPNLGIVNFWRVNWDHGVGTPRILHSHPASNPLLINWQAEDANFSMTSAGAASKGWLSQIDSKLMYFGVASSQHSPGSPDSWESKLLYGIDANMTEEGPEGDINYGGDINPAEHNQEEHYDMQRVFGVGKPKFHMPDYASVLNKKLSFYVNSETLDKLRDGDEINIVLDFVERDYSDIAPFDTGAGGYYDPVPTKNDFDLYQYIERNELQSDRYGFSVILSFRGNPDTTDKFEVEQVGSRYKISREFTIYDSDGRGVGNRGDTIPAFEYALIRPFNHLEAGTKIVGSEFGRTHLFPPMYSTKEIPIGSWTLDDITMRQSNQSIDISNNHVKTSRHKLDSDINSANYVPTQYGYSWPIGASHPERRFFSIDGKKEQIIDGGENYPSSFPPNAEVRFSAGGGEETTLFGIHRDTMRFYNQIGFGTPFWGCQLRPVLFQFKLPYRYKTIIVPFSSLGNDNQRLQYFKNFDNFSSHGYSSLEFNFVGHRIDAVTPANVRTPDTFYAINPQHPNEDFRE